MLYSLRFKEEDFIQVQFDPALKAASAQAPIEIRPSLAPLGSGDGTTTLQSIAPAEDSGCCLWNMLSSIWNWLKWLCFCSSKAESTAKIQQNTQKPPQQNIVESPAEIQQNAQELRQQNIEQNIKQILKDHFSDFFLDEMDQPKWKAAVFIDLNGQFFVQCRQLTRESAIPFRDEISNQVDLKEFIKNNLETLSLNSRLKVETYCMNSVNGKNIIINQCSSSESAADPMNVAVIVSNDWERTEPLSRGSTLEYLELSACPNEICNFFLNP